MSRSRLAAEHRRATGCSISVAAKLFGISEGPVARTYKQMYEGLVRDRSRERPGPRRLPRANPILTTPLERLVGAVEFMIKYDTTARKAAETFSVPAEEVIAAFNERTGARRQLCG